MKNRLCSTPWPGLALCLVCAATVCMAQQPAGVILGAGNGANRSPVPLFLAGGQVVTIYATGVGGRITERVSADKLPWPTELAGISAEFTPSALRWKAAIGQIEPFSTCDDSPFSATANAECGRVLAITIHVPEVLATEARGESHFEDLALVVRDKDGQQTGKASVFSTRPNPSILTRCQVPYLPIVRGISTGHSNCLPMVFHADGSGVSESAPAAEGETLVVYAHSLDFGPLVEAGHPTPEAYDLRGTLENDAPGTYRMEYRFGESVTMSFMGGGQNRLEADYIGRTPGEVGLYQANFRVPKIPAGLARCNSDLGVGTNLAVAVVMNKPRFWHRFNLYPPPFDWFGICVDPGSRQTQEGPRR